MSCFSCSLARCSRCPMQFASVQHLMHACCVHAVGLDCDVIDRIDGMVCVCVCVREKEREERLVM